MGGRFSSSVATIIFNATGANGESIVATTGNISPAFDGSVIVLQWSIDWVQGAAPVNPSFRLRRGAALTSTLLYTSPIYTGLVSLARVIGGIFVDTAPALAGAVYSLTVNNTNAAASEGFTNVNFFAYAL